MAYLESLSAMNERAARIESMEGTVKLKYKEEPDDAKNYTGGVKKRFILLTSIVCISLVVMLAAGIALSSSPLYIFSGTMLLFEFVFVAIVIVGIRKNKSLENKHLDDVELAFNVYGVVFRMCSDIRYAVFAYEWNDFESITEYDKVLVGVKQNVAYIFPKRVFTEEEYNKFRRFSYAAIGRKCVYKNFKP